METTRVEAAIVGAGFAGIGMAIRLRDHGIDDFVILERGDGPGGTWRDNSYPGCQCDVPSHLYSYSFAPEPGWSRTFSTQPEIRRYIERTAEERGVAGHIRYGTCVTQARFDEDTLEWVIETPAGDYRARYLVMANGPLSEPKLPDVPGLESFGGRWFHSAAWDHDHDLTGERVAIVGTGASAVQFAPHVQERAAHVAVFQRTAPWVLPHPDRRITRFERWLFRRLPLTQKVARAFVYLWREGYVLGMAKFTPLMKAGELISRRHMRKHIADSGLRRLLMPDYRAGCKRLLLSDDWYRTVAQPNVTVVASGVSEVRPGSVVDAGGREHPVDTIIFGTGFHVTDNPIWRNVLGRGGRSVMEAWKGAGMGAYLGTSVPGFPNMFILAGPNTGIGHTSLLVMIEAQIEHILACMRHVGDQRAAGLEVTQDAHGRFAALVRSRMPGTVWSSGGCASWYLDEHGRNPTIWPDFTWRFVRMARRLRPDDYRLLARDDLFSQNADISPPRLQRSLVGF